MKGVYRELFWEDLRLAILRCLAEASAQSVNDSLLFKALVAISHTATRDQVGQALAWLAEQGLVTVAPIDGIALNSVTLLERGEDVALGRATVPGVARPSRPR
jgi:hypothetical protein